MKFNLNKPRKDARLGDIVVCDKDIYLIVKTLGYDYTVVNMSGKFVSDALYKTIEDLMEDYFAVEEDLRIIPRENIVVSTI